MSVLAHLGAAIEPEAPHAARAPTGPPAAGAAGCCRTCCCCPAGFGWQCSSPSRSSSSRHQPLRPGRLAGRGLRDDLGSSATTPDVLAGYWPHFVRSLVYAGVATALCCCSGYPLAYAIAQKAGRWKNLMLICVIAPFFTSFLVRTLAWKTILSDNGWLVGAPA